ncbi:hypothetical protein [Bacillus massilinigeriensis]|uniref:hypothetical protein n=1 Tax=Bacillus mediterraneensis TaxID=1805474 RepID=UPI0008F91D60|nr:hypothetical protein [Bacillus mediterraneensis]
MNRMLAVLLALALLAGCGMFDNSQSGYKDEDKQGKAISTRDDGNVGGGHDINASDGMDRTMSDQNPNFPDIGGNRHNFSDDVAKARETVASVKGFKADEVWIDGGTMNVSVLSSKNLSSGEKEKQAAKIKQKLTNALPRYNIDVNMENGK